ncbi:MAG: nuclear transport factor 2 family protein [Pseudolysinimonas sp.]
MSNSDIVHQFMTAFQTQDRELAESLAADDFHFTSPQDAHIDRAEWFEKCFPSVGHFTDHRLLQVIEADDDLVLLRYEYELENGERYRNCEAQTVRDGQIHEVEVYFGGQV